MVARRRRRRTGGGRMDEIRNSDGCQRVTPAQMRANDTHHHVRHIADGVGVGRATEGGSAVGGEWAAAARWSR